MSSDGWIVKKMWFLYAVEYCSAIKRNEIWSFVEMRVDLESVIQSEVSHEKENSTNLTFNM